MKIFNCSISPGTMGACALVIDLVGVENVNPGNWMGPVWAKVSEHDLPAFKELLAGYGLTVWAEGETCC